MRDERVEEMRLWTSAVIVFLLAAMVARAVQWAVVDADGLETVGRHEWKT